MLTIHSSATSIDFDNTSLLSQEQYVRCQGLVLIQYCYLLSKGGYVFDSGGLSVCLSVDNIIQNVMNELG